VFLKGQINEAGLLMAILLSRLIMVVGDVLFFLFAILTDRWGILSTWGKNN
jgi:hypothetical protein